MRSLKPLHRAAAPRHPPTPAAPTLPPAELTEDELAALRQLAEHPCAWVPITYAGAHRRLEQAGALQLRIPDEGRRVAWRSAGSVAPWKAHVTARGRAILVEQAPTVQLLRGDVEYG